MTSSNVINKVAQKLTNSVLHDQIQIMLQHFETYNFLQIHKNNLELNGHGQNLKEIVRYEWLLKNITLNENPAFCVKEFSSKNCLKTAFNKIKNIVSDLPFSFIEIYNVPLNHKTKSCMNNAVDMVKNQFQINCGTILKIQTLCNPQMSLELFHKQQREDKIWWKKFAAMPGRFNTTEIISDENTKFLEIKAEFPWGFETVEVIKYLPEALLHDPCSFEVKKGKKKYVPHIISCETSLENMTFTYLCDSYDILNNKNSGNVLRFCRKLAPFKVAFAGKTNSDDAEILKDLAIFLAKQIRKCGISVLHLPDMCSTSLERQICRNDAIGVPFTIIFNEKTLKDGIILIRSRDTTLEEQSHISLIVPYVEKLMKNG